MKVFKRAQAITPFLAMEFGKHAAALEAAGHHVIRLNLGEPDFGAPPAVRAEPTASALQNRHNLDGYRWDRAIGAGQNSRFCVQ
jgi:aspartate/methionine/tyrosine aminotransferase